MSKTITGRCTLLGTGGSSGVPVIGCTCSVCQSTDPKNKRLRPAAVLQFEDRTVLIDCGPDIRQQALRHGVDHVDGVALTHVHFDHTAGIDDLRAYYFQSRKPLPCIASQATIDDITHRCAYLFEPPARGRSFTAQIEFQVLHGDRGVTDFVGLHTRYLSYEQGGMHVNGFRWGDFAYISDIKEYPDTIFEDLAGVKTLVLSALRYESSFLHFTIDDAIAFSQRVGATETWITHIAHELDHKKTNARLPDGIQLGYDGLQFEFEAPLSP